MAGREPILLGRGLTKRYGRVVALDNCDFDLYPARSWRSSATTARASPR
jgi:ABC-type phosphonate transport system ATPase subunit